MPNDTLNKKHRDLLDIEAMLDTPGWLVLEARLNERIADSVAEMEEQILKDDTLGKPKAVEAAAKARAYRGVFGLIREIIADGRSYLTTIS